MCTTTIPATSASVHPLLGVNSPLRAPPRTRPSLLNKRAPDLPPSSLAATSASGPRVPRTSSPLKVLLHSAIRRLPDTSPPLAPLLLPPFHTRAPPLSPSPAQTVSNSPQV